MQCIHRACNGQEMVLNSAKTHYVCPNSGCRAQIAVSTVKHLEARQTESSEEATEPVQTAAKPDDGDKFAGWGKQRYEVSY